MNILRWVLSILVTLWVAIFIFLPVLFMFIFNPSDKGNIILLCLAAIILLFNILGTILGNLKSPWYYLFYLPSILAIIAPIIAVFIGFIIIPAIAM